MKLKPVIAEMAKEHQRMGAEMTNTGCLKSDNAQKVVSIDTKREIAKIAGVGHDTVAKVKKIEAVASPEVRIGELMRSVPKTQGERTDRQLLPSGGSKSKRKAIENAGFSKTQVQRFEELASHPEAVAEAKAEARENDDIVSRSEASHWRGSPAISPE